MADRVHLVMDAEEKERYRRLAAREGKTLSEWLRAAAREKAARTRKARSLDTVEALDAFFEECRAREAGRGREPDWEEHLRVIERSIASGTTDT